MESNKVAKKASVQSVAKKIGDQVRKAQSLASSDGEAGFEKTLSSLTRRAKTLQTGLARLPESTDALRASGDKLNASVFLFVEAARKARVAPASGRGAMDRAAFDVHSILSIVKREAASVAREMSAPDLELKRTPREKKERSGTERAAAEAEKKKPEKTESANLRASVVLSRSSQAAAEPGVSAEEGRKKAREGLAQLQLTAERGARDDYARLEKECALLLSVVIRNLKSIGSRAAAEQLLHETQKMVAIGRATLAISNCESEQFKSQLSAFRESVICVTEKMEEPEPARPNRAPPIVSSQSSEPQKPTRAPPVSPRDKKTVNEKVASPRSTAAVGVENSKVQIVGARKTTAAQELLAAHGITAPEVPVADSAVLSPREMKRQKEEKKKEEKKTLSKRRKEKLRRASVSLTNEEKRQIAKSKLEQLKEEEDKKKKQLAIEELEERRLRLAEEKEEADKKKKQDEEEARRREEEEEEEEEEKKKREAEEAMARAEAARRRAEEKEEEEKKKKELERERRARQEELEQYVREEEERNRVEKLQIQLQLEAANKAAEEEAKRQFEKEEEEMRQQSIDNQSALEASIREKEQRLQIAKAKKKEEKRQAHLEKMKREKESLQREKEQEMAEMISLKRAEDAKQELRLKAEAEMKRLEKEIQEKNEALERAAREAADVELAALRSEEDRKKKELSARLAAEEEQRRAVRERERLEEEANARKVEIETQRLRILEEQRLAAAKKLREDEESRRSKRATSQANNSPMMRSSQATSVISSPAGKKGVLRVRLCEDCGQEAGPDPYCDNCAGNVIEIEVEDESFRKFSVPAAALAAQPRKKKGKNNGEQPSSSEESEETMRVCCECGEEAGKEGKCKLCGGEVIGLDCDDLDAVSPAGKSMDTAHIYDSVAQLEKELGLK